MANCCPTRPIISPAFSTERPLSRLRADLATLGIERVANNSEPEDHAAILCEIMSGLADGCLDASAEAQRAFFEKHVSPWMGRLFADMEGADDAASIGRSARSAAPSSRSRRKHSHSPTDQHTPVQERCDE